MLSQGPKTTITKRLQPLKILKAEHFREVPLATTLDADVLPTKHVMQLLGGDCGDIW